MAAHGGDYKNLSDADGMMYADMIGAQAGQVSPTYAQDELALNDLIQRVSTDLPTESSELTSAINNGLVQLRAALGGDGQVLLELEGGEYAMAANDAVSTERILQQAMATINAGLSASGVPVSGLQNPPNE